MRTYVSSDEIAHLWAHQAQPSARCSASMSFSGKEFYSYDTIIAAITQAKDGRRVFLLTKTGLYSGTTSHHQWLTYDAVPLTAIRFFVPGYNGGSSFSDSTHIMAAWSNEITQLLTEANVAKRDVKKVRLMAEASQIVVEMCRFADVMGIKKPSFPAIPGNPTELADALKREAARKERMAKAAAKKATARSADDLKKWLAGERIGYFNLGLMPVALRIIAGEVETSRGVHVPIAHARRALKLVDKVRSTGKHWETNGHTCQVGHYRIDAIDPDGIVYAGCHVIPFEAIKCIRPQLSNSVL